MGVGFVNNVKTAILMGALMGLIVAAAAAIGGPQALVPALVIGGVMNIGAFLFSHKIAIASMRGRELTAETGGDLYRMVEELSANAGLPMPKVYLCPHQAPNAFATGPSPSKAAVAFTQGAVELLDREEMRGVIAHELAHIKNRDTLISTIAATVAGVFSMLAYWFLMFGGMGMGRGGGNPLAMIGVILLGAVGAAILKSMISRSREFVADADGARIAGSPHGLVSALQKLEAYAGRVPLRQPNPAANNMFIVEPMISQAHGGGFSLGNLFASHPPTPKRIEALLRDGY